MVVDDDKRHFISNKTGLELDENLKQRYSHGGESVLKAFEAHPDEYQSILTDIRMPNEWFSVYIVTLRKEFVD